MNFTTDPLKGTACTGALSQLAGCSVSVSQMCLPQSQPLSPPAPNFTATVILLIGSFSHKSCHPPNKAIKMFVCIIEGKVLP